MQPSIEAIEGHHEVHKGLDTYRVTGTPNHGPAFTVYVASHEIRSGRVEYRTAATPDFHRYSYYQKHRTFESAVKAANNRVKRYLRMHRRPFGIHAQPATAAA